jgi:hypothetical protein
VFELKVTKNSTLLFNPKNVPLFIGFIYILK